MDKRIIIKTTGIVGTNRHSLYPGIIGQVAGVKQIKWKYINTVDTEVPSLGEPRPCFKVIYPLAEETVFIPIEDFVKGYYNLVSIETN